MRKQPIIWAAIFAAVAVAWLADLLGGGAAAGWGAAKMGDKLMAAADGKITDPSVFLRGRLRETVWLLTCFVALALLLRAVAVWSRPRTRVVRWVALSLAGFVALNAAAWAGGKTVLFWIVMWKGTGGWENLSQHEIKRLLMQENRRGTPVALLGSSQTQAQIDEALLNRLGQGRWWATDLNFPGNQSFDLLLTWRRLEAPKPDVAVCYLSVGSFYNGFASEGLRVFFRLGDLPLWWQGGGRAAGLPSELAYGLLGDVVPIFRMRDTVSQRCLGSAVTVLPQQRYDTALSQDLMERARAAAKVYRADGAVALQQWALERLAQECAAAGTTLVLIPGQVNPLLAAEIDPGLHAGMQQFLRALAARHTNIVLLAESDLPVQVPADYKDLTHVNEAARERFTRYLATQLEASLPRSR